MENLILLIIDNDIIAVAVAAILGGGILTGIAVYRKTNPEISKITVEIAGQAVIVQKGVIDSLQNELLRQGTDLKLVEAENERCQQENKEFRKTIENLQRQLASHNVRIEKIEEKHGNE